MKKRPVIGISYLGCAPRRLYMMANYQLALRRAGAKPKILRWTTDPAVIADYCKACDGFVLPGGVDIDPAQYGRPREPLCGPSDAARDAFELLLLRTLLPTQTPILGICRGCQALAVANGGTLIQDIVHLQKLTHRDRKNIRRGTHPVILTPGDSLLRQALPEGENTLRVNTLHHQVVEQPGPGMRVIACSPDGFIEAIQKEDRAFCMGVQWHPEHMILRDSRHQKIFDLFAAACRAGKK